eukprot:1185766-Prorocentrum_minimum.AAC.2
MLGGRASGWSGSQVTTTCGERTTSRTCCAHTAHSVSGAQNIPRMCHMPHMCNVLHASYVSHASYV